MVTKPHRWCLIPVTGGEDWWRQRSVVDQDIVTPLVIHKRIRVGDCLGVVAVFVMGPGRDLVVVASVLHAVLDFLLQWWKIGAGEELFSLALLTAGEHSLEVEDVSFPLLLNLGQCENDYLSSFVIVVFFAGIAHIGIRVDVFLVVFYSQVVALVALLAAIVPCQWR